MIRSLAICRSHRWNGITGSSKVILQPPIRLDHDLLHDITGVHPLLNASIESQFDHPPERLAMPIQQLTGRLGVARLGIVDQFLSLFALRPIHRSGRS